jgi:hypothetical protein
VKMALEGMLAARSSGSECTGGSGRCRRNRAAGTRCRRRKPGIQSGAAGRGSRRGGAAAFPPQLVPAPESHGYPGRGNFGATL